MPDIPTGPIPFKVFGLQRTGTNLMVALLTRNFLVHSLEIGAEWKHGPVEEPDRAWNGTPARFVLCVKNPRAWLVSCFRYFRAALGADETVARQFAQSPSMSFPEFVVSPSYEFANPLDRWNRMYQLWLDTLPPDRTLLVRHEDQLEDQLTVLGAAQRKLGLTAIGPLRPIDERVDVNAAIGSAMNRDYYLNREYLAEFPPALLDWVNQNVSQPLMDRFGYSRTTSHPRSSAQSAV